MLMTYMEALELALSKEKEAIEMYKRLSIEHSAIKDLMIELQNEEYKHKKLIEKKIVELRSN
jgi:rubrerythrin